MEDCLHYEPQQASAAVIPAYQPEATLPALAQALADDGHVVLVVDDGSGAAYASVWQQLPPGCIVLHHAVNRGKGAALKTAFTYIAEALPCVGCIVTVDADGQHLPPDAMHAALAAWTNPGTLVLGSRSFSGDIPLRSRLGNRITRSVFRAVSGLRLQDTQTGLRAFDLSLLDQMRAIPGERYEYETNVLLYCSRNRIPVREIPIATVYLDRKNSCSHFSTLRDSLRIYRNLLRFFLSSAVSFAADYLLFLLLTAVLPAGPGRLLASNILARTASASLNYTLNARSVFHDGRPWQRTLPQYAALAAGILAANSLLLSALAHGLGLPAAAAKLLTELLLFSASYLVQSRWIFRGSGQRGGGTHDACTDAARP